MKTNLKSENLLYKNEVFQIIGAGFEVYNELGNGFLEKVYEDALKIEFSRRGLSFKSQVQLPIKYKGVFLERNYQADFILFDKIIVELKATSHLTNTEDAQLLNYLKASGFKLGLLLNFGHPQKMEWKRKILSHK